MRLKFYQGYLKAKQTGTPIGLLIRNQDQRSKDYSNIKDQFRPGHADLTYQAKYGVRDYRGGGRSSARETVMRVAAGAIAKKYLSEQFNMQVRAYMYKMGDIEVALRDWSVVESNPFFCGDSAAIERLEAEIKRLRKDGNSVGAGIEVHASNMPAGIGEPVF